MAAESVCEALARSRICANLSDSDVTELVEAGTQRVELAGVSLLRDTSELLVLLDGTVELKTDIGCTKLGAGAVLNELAFPGGTPSRKWPGP